SGSEAARLGAKEKGAAPLEPMERRDAGAMGPLAMGASEPDALALHAAHRQSQTRVDRLATVDCRSRVSRGHHIARRPERRRMAQTWNRKRIHARRYAAFARHGVGRNPRGNRGGSTMNVLIPVL